MPRGTGPISRKPTRWWPTRRPSRRSAAKGSRPSPTRATAIILIYLLEQGEILRTIGRLDESTKAFDAADRYFVKIDEKPYVRVGREAYAAVTNLAELSYEGYGYDRIMANAYKALNYMEQGNMDYARAELKLRCLCPERIQKHKDKQIKEAQEARNEPGDAGGYDVNRAMNDPRFNAQTASVYGNLPNNQARAVYVNAYAEYLQGIFFLFDGDSQTARWAGRPSNAPPRW